MENRILELIYDHYLSGHLAPLKNTTLDSEKDFIEKYIMPLYQTDPDASVDMEDCFTNAMADSDMLNFFNGFKACLQFVMGCLDSDFLS